MSIRFIEKYFYQKIHFHFRNWKQKEEDKKESVRSIKNTGTHTHITKNSYQDMSLLIYFILLFLLVEVTCKEKLSKSFIIQTTNGEPWPMPQSINTFPSQVNIDPDSFRFIYNETSHQCDLLTNAFLRYYKLIFFPETYWLDILEEPPARKKKFPKRNMIKVEETQLLKNVKVNIRDICAQWPTFESNESCK